MTAVPSTHNQWKLADASPAEKKRAWERYKKLMADQKMVAARMRDVITDGKAFGYSPQLVRVAHRLERMTPEKREKWIADMSGAAVLFGWKMEQQDEDARPKELWDLLTRATKIWTEKREVSAMKKDLQEQCGEAGIDFRALKHTFNFHKLDSAAKEAAQVDETHTAWEDLVIAVEKFGSDIGIW